MKNYTGNIPHSKTLRRARDFAIEWHGNQRYGDWPYVYHLDRVVELMRDLTNANEMALGVGYLHDVLEDTTVSTGLIRSEFGDQMLRYVQALTDPKEGTRAEKKLHMYRQWKMVDPEDWQYILIPKAADRLANMLECRSAQNRNKARMYLYEFCDFQRAVWRPRLCPIIWYQLEWCWNQLKGMIGE